MIDQTTVPSSFPCNPAEVLVDLGRAGKSALLPGASLSFGKESVAFEWDLHIDMLTVVSVWKGIAIFVCFCNSGRIWKMYIYSCLITDLPVSMKVINIHINFVPS